MFGSRQPAGGCLAQLPGGEEPPLSPGRVGSAPLSPPAEAAAEAGRRTASAGWTDEERQSKGEPASSPGPAIHHPQTERVCGDVAK